jgi:hypothetical protein
LALIEMLVQGMSAANYPVTDITKPIKKSHHSEIPKT